ncbi:hypothetical protein [Sutcliffiella deserti]|uniref:hypothetical protein n=1 Tax=Sutcliffiella deserti TaxID=2875501 RepID=UPI001CBF9A6B|nr:hypothetical protein [Sutcliffiella deserti]
MPELLVRTEGNTKKYIVNYKVGSEIGISNGRLIREVFDTLEDAEVFMEITKNKGSVIFAHLLK